MQCGILLMQTDTMETIAEATDSGSAEVGWCTLTAWTYTVDVRAYADRQADNKRRMNNNSRDNNAQQLPYKRQNVARAYSVGPSEKKEYARTLPLCNKPDDLHWVYESVNEIVLVLFIALEICDIYLEM
ncbi:hypothetical protein Tco_1047987 [Tanacetum coccineum]